jgi:DNA helicase-2/ATP-dependent DNA helicase PcrA
MKENENGGSLFDFLNETALYTDLDRDDTSTDWVNLMTMHSAKGLEFDTVFIVGAEEGLFPGIRAIGDPSELEEERRLCYVAMTRAMRRLYFSCARQRMLFGKTSAARSSRFVREIGVDNLEIRETTNSFGHSDFTSAGQFRQYVDTGVKKPMSGDFGAGAAVAGKRPEAAATKPVSKLTDYCKGDEIMHKAFGRGIITDITKGGGDALLEIAFDEIGTKRLMFNTTARYMTKG